MWVSWLLEFSCGLIRTFPFLDVPGQENVLAESRMMIPDCRKRLESALAELKATLVFFHQVFYVLTIMEFDTSNFHNNFIMVC